MVFIDEFSSEEVNFDLCNRIVKVCPSPDTFRALPIFLISNQPPINIKMNKINKVMVNQVFEVIQANSFENDTECYNRPLRFIQSMATIDVPLTLEQIESKLIVD